jgi:phosphohistidine phosphatase
MAKTLLLIRHAKSDWADQMLSDFNRPLNHRGEINAPEMAKRLVKRALFPQQFISSPALRAISTANHFAKELKINPTDIIQENKIYDALTNSLLEVVNNLDESSNFTALFGHNPGITGLVNYLTNQEIFNIPTCGMALIKFPFDQWKMLSSGTGELVFFDFPKNNSLI